MKNVIGATAIHYTIMEIAATGNFKCDWLTNTLLSGFAHNLA